MSTTTYPNLPKIEFITLDGEPIDCSRDLLPEIHKPGNTTEGKPFADNSMYRLTMHHNGNLFSCSKYYHGYDLNTKALDIESTDEIDILTYLLKCAADTKGESGKYDLNISVFAGNKEYILGVLLPDGSILETITLEK